MTFDLEEQEQLDELKAWWKANGATVILVAAVFLATVAAVQGWRYYQRNQGDQAAALYGTLQQTLASSDGKRIRDAAALVMERFPRTAYASRAALISAKVSFDAGDTQSASLQLQWVIDHAGEEELVEVARLRLAGILLDQKKYDDSLRLLDAKHGESFDGLYADLRADVLAAQGKVAEARAAYRMALERTDKKSPYRNLIQIKLDALGG